MHRIPTPREQRILRRENADAGVEAATVEEEDAPPADEAAEEQEDADETEHVDVELLRGTGGMVYSHVPLEDASDGCVRYRTRSNRSLLEQAAARSTPKRNASTAHVMPMRDSHS